MKWFLLLFVFLIGCGSKDIHHQSPTVDLNNKRIKLTEQVLLKDDGYAIVGLYLLKIDDCEYIVLHSGGTGLTITEHKPIGKKD